MPLTVNLETWKPKRIRKRPEENAEAQPGIGRCVVRKPACWGKTPSPSVHPPIPESPPKPSEPTPLEPARPRSSWAEVGLPLSAGSQTGSCRPAPLPTPWQPRKPRGSEISHLSESKGPRSHIPGTSNGARSQAASASLTCWGLRTAPSQIRVSTSEGLSPPCHLCLGPRAIGCGGSGPRMWPRYPPRGCPEGTEGSPSWVWNQPRKPKARAARVQNACFRH